MQKSAASSFGLTYRDTASEKVSVVKMARMGKMLCDSFSE